MSLENAGVKTIKFTSKIRPFITRANEIAFIDREQLLDKFETTESNLQLFNMIVVSFVVDLLITKQIPARRVSLTDPVHRAAVKRQTQCDRGRGGTGVLGTVGGHVGSRSIASFYR